MPALSLFVAVALFIGYMFSQNQNLLTANAASTEASAISGNMSVYRTAVVNYARTNTGVTGTVADAALGLPTWFNHMPAVVNYVSGGTGYVYYPSPQPELAYLLVQASNNSMLAGIKRSGMLYSPVTGTATIPLPAAIPDGSVVYFGS